MIGALLNYKDGVINSVLGVNMIKITSLNKIYKSKNKQLHPALNNINLSLPDKGLVFLLGKSGSGKSTLLNLIGGLSRTTSGKIEVDGNDLFSLKENDLANYRNTQVGFIFQDFFLLDKLTVYENIALAMQIQGKNEVEPILSALNDVGLSKHANKYPDELSGGERQRVAIARAIVKNPSIILADEPTGNLDPDTAISIFDLLRSFSKDKLVFVISHDKKIANKYADRIIELENGRIVSDKTKNPDFSEDIALFDGELFCPIEKELSDEDFATINKYLAKGTRIIRSRVKYIDTQAQETVSKKIHIKKIRNTNNVGIQKEFLKPMLQTIFVRSFIVAIIITVFMLALTITSFDPNEIIKTELENTTSNSVFLTKTVDDTQSNQIVTFNKAVSGFPKVEESDITSFRKAGYEGDIYKVLKCNLSINKSQVSAGITTTIFEESLYALEPLGIMLVDENFITEKFGQLEYLAKAETFHPSGIIVTDYLADIMLKSEHLSETTDYSELIGEYHWGAKESTNIISRGYINAVIKTDYKEKYKSVLKKAQNYDASNFENLLNDEDALSFLDDIHTKYGFCYSFNPNFCTDAIENPAWDMVWHYALRFENGDFFVSDIPQVRKADFYGIYLKENEVLMELSAYNQIFGTSYTVDTLDSFSPHTEVLSHYLYSQYGEKDALFSQEVRIAGLFYEGQNNMSGTFIAGDGIFDLFAKNCFYTIGLYFDGDKSIVNIVDTAYELGYQKNLIISENTRMISKAVGAFIPVFSLFSVILCIAVVFILTNYSTRLIKSKIQQIGILKAIGAKSKTIGLVFGIQILLIAVLTALLSLLGYYVFIDFTNDLLLSSFQTVISGKMILDLDFIAFSPAVVLQSCILIFVLAIISFIYPMIKIRKLDPVNIMKTKE